MTIPNTLPSFDGKPLVKPKSKSTDRHSREIADRVARMQGLSTTMFRRAKIILLYGSDEVQQLVRDDKVSIWRAYNFVVREQEAKAIKIFLGEPSQ